MASRKRNVGDGDYMGTVAGDGFDESKKGKFGPTKVVYVRNMPEDVSDLEVMGLFAPFGRVVGYTVLKAKGQGFFQLEDVSHATAAVEHYKANPVNIRGRTLVVAFSNRDEVTNARPLLSNGDSAAMPATGERNDENPSPVLLVAVLNMTVPITIDIIHKVCSRLGAVQKIVLFEKHGKFQAFVQFPDIPSATRAKQGLDGQNIYTGCCTLRVSYSNMTELSVKVNGDRSRDFTNPSLPTGQASGAYEAAPQSNAYSQSMGYGQQLAGYAQQPPAYGEQVQPAMSYAPASSYSQPSGYTQPSGYAQSSLSAPRAPSVDAAFPQAAVAAAALGIQPSTLMNALQMARATPTAQATPGLPAPSYPQGMNPAAALGGYPQAPPAPPVSGAMPGYPYPQPTAQQPFYPGYAQAGPGLGMQGPGQAYAPPSRDLGYLTAIMTGHSGSSGGGSAAGGVGTVLIVTRLPPQATPDSLFMLFGVYGDVERVKIMYNKKDTALIQFRTLEEATRAKEYLHNLMFYGSKINVGVSKFPEITINDKARSQMEQDPESCLTRDFAGSKLHRFRVQGSRNALNLAAPSDTLHLSNLPDSMTEDQVIALFEAQGPVVGFKFFGKERRMALIRMGSLEDAVTALINLHNQVVEGRNIRVSFSKQMIQPLAAQ